MLRFSATIGLCLKPAPKSNCFRNLSQSTWKASNAASATQEKIFSPISKEPREVQIPVPWGHISGKWWGATDKQPMLGFHGWQDNAATYDNLVPLLNVDSFLAIDMVGHGNSSPYPIGQCYHYIDEVVNIGRVINHYKWDKVALMGHSLGSTLGTAFAAYFPDKVSMLIQLDCTRSLIYDDDINTADHVRNVIESTLAMEKRMMAQLPPSYSYEDILELFYQGNRQSIARECCNLILKRGTKKTEDGKYFFSRDPRMKVIPIGFYNEEMLLAVASAVQCEVLSLRAKEGATFGGDIERIFLETLVNMEKSAKRFEHHDLDGTHHFHLNTPENIAPVINRFLAAEKGVKVY